MLCGRTYIRFIVIEVVFCGYTICVVCADESLRQRTFLWLVEVERVLRAMRCVDETVIYIVHKAVKVHRKRSFAYQLQITNQLIEL